jgi:rhodanese-related sulfurtransferase
MAPTLAIITIPGLPQTEAAVPRVSVEDAKAAFDSGEAIIVDVRSTEAYAEGHVAGALSIQLGEFETDIANVKLDRNQWIITYCT